MTEVSAMAESYSKRTKEILFEKEDQKWNLAAEYSLLIGSRNGNTWEVIRNNIAKDSGYIFTAKEVQEHYLKVYANGPLGGFDLDCNKFAPFHLDLEFKVPFDKVKSVLTSDETASTDLQDQEFQKISYNPYRDEFRKEFDVKAENVIQNLTSIPDFNTTAGAYLPFIRDYSDRIFMRSEIKKFVKNHRLLEQYFKDGRSLMKYVKRKKLKKDFVKRDDFKELTKWMRYRYMFPKSEDYYSFVCGFLKERFLKKKIREVNQKMQSSCSMNKLDREKFCLKHKRVHPVGERNNKSFAKRNETEGLESKPNDKVPKIQEKINNSQPGLIRTPKIKERKQKMKKVYKTSSYKQNEKNHKKLFKDDEIAAKSQTENLGKAVVKKMQEHSQPGLIGMHKIKERKHKMKNVCKTKSHEQNEKYHKKLFKADEIAAKSRSKTLSKTVVKKMQQHSQPVLMGTHKIKQKMKKTCKTSSYKRNEKNDKKLFKADEIAAKSQSENLSKTVVKKIQEHSLPGLIGTHKIKEREQKTKKVCKTSSYEHNEKNHKKLVKADEVQKEVAIEKQIKNLTKTDAKKIPEQEDNSQPGLIGTPKPKDRNQKIKKVCIASSYKQNEKNHKKLFKADEVKKKVAIETQIKNLNETDVKKMQEHKDNSQPGLIGTPKIKEKKQKEKKVGKTSSFEQNEKNNKKLFKADEVKKEIAIEMHKKYASKSWYEKGKTHKKPVEISKMKGNIFDSQSAELHKNDNQKLMKNNLKRHEKRLKAKGIVENKNVNSHGKELREIFLKKLKAKNGKRHKKHLKPDKPKKKLTIITQNKEHNEKDFENDNSFFKHQKNKNKIYKHGELMNCKSLVSKQKINVKSNERKGILSNKLKMRRVKDNKAKEQTSGKLGTGKKPRNNEVLKACNDTLLDKNPKPSEVRQESCNKPLDIKRKKTQRVDGVKENLDFKFKRQEKRKAKKIKVGSDVRDVMRNLVKATANILAKNKLDENNREESQITENIVIKSCKKIPLDKNKNPRKVRQESGNKPLAIKRKKQRRVDRAKENLNFKLKRQEKRKAEEEVYEKREAKKLKVGSDIRDLMRNLVKETASKLAQNKLEENNREKSQITGNIAIKSCNETLLDKNPKPSKVRQESGNKPLVIKRAKPSRTDRAKENVDFKFKRRGKRNAEDELYQKREAKKLKVGSDVRNLMRNSVKAAASKLAKNKLDENNRENSQITGNVVIKSAPIPDGISTCLDIQAKRHKKKSRSKLVNVFEMLSEEESNSSSSDEFHGRVSIVNEIDASKEEGLKKVRPKFGVLTCEGYDMLSREEKELCHRLCLLPIYYIAYKIILVTADEEKLCGGTLRSSCLYPTDLPRQYCDQIFEFMAACGWIQSDELLEEARLDRQLLAASSNMALSGELPKQTTLLPINRRGTLRRGRFRTALRRRAASNRFGPKNRCLNNVPRRKGQRKH